MSADSLFFLLVPPKVHPELKNQSVPLNSQFSMTCIVSGDPTPIVNWTKNGTHLVNTSNTVTISHVSFDDEGQYGCYAQNRAGKVNKTIWLDVTGKSNIMMEFLLYI